MKHLTNGVSTVYKRPMQLRIERFKTDEFRKFMIAMLNGSMKQTPPCFIIERIYALASDGREQQLESSIDATKARWSYKGQFCEGEILIGLRVEYGDKTKETLTFPYQQSTVDTAELDFSINF